MQTLSPAPNERTIQGKLMRKVTIGLLVFGVVVLHCVELAVALGTGVALRLTVAANRASPVAAVLSMREWVQIIMNQARRNSVTAALGCFWPAQKLAHAVISARRRSNRSVRR